MSGEKGFEKDKSTGQKKDVRQAPKGGRDTGKRGGTHEGNKRKG